MTYRHRLVTAAVTAVVLAGCAGAAAELETSGPAPTSDDATEERVVEFWYMPNGPTPAEHVAREVEEFSAQHPGVTVEVTELEWESALTRIITAATSGEGPDVFQIGTTWVPGVADLGVLMEWSEAELDTIGGDDAFVAPSWTSTRPLGIDATVAVPWFLDTRAGFYRTDVFEDLGLDPVEVFADWDAFEHALMTIAEDGQMHPLAISGANDWNVVHDMAPWLWAAGGDFLTADASAAAVTTEAATTGVDTYQRLVASYNHPEAFELSTADAQQLFVAGDAAITFGSSYVVNELRTSFSEGEASVRGWATAAFPTGPSGREPFLGGSNLAIMANTEVRDAALDWVAHLTSEESQLRYTGAIGMLPSRQAALESEELLADEGFQPFVEQLPDGRQYPPMPEWLHVEVALQHHFGELWHEVAERGEALPRHEVEERMRGLATDIDAALTDDA